MKGRTKETLIKEIIKSSNSISEDIKQDLLEYWKSKQLYMKNGIFCLEYDKETLSDMVFELQQENKQLKTQLSGTTFCYDEDEHKELKNINEKLSLALESAESKIDKAIEYLEAPNRDGFDYSTSVLLEILKGSDK